MNTISLYKHLQKPTVLAIFNWLSISALIVLLTPFMEKTYYVSCLLVVLSFFHFFVNREKNVTNLSQFQKKYFIFALVVVIGIVIEFWYRFQDIDILISFSESIGVDSYVLLTVISVVLGIIAIPGIALSMKYLCENIFDSNEIKYDSIKPFIKPFVIFFIIYSCSLITIIRANYNYIDDMERVFVGFKGWEDFSRFLSNYLSNYIHANTYLADISPIPQILTAAILSVSSIIVLFVITGKKHFRFIEYCAALPLGLSPYFLECISYKYDSPYMAISILASVIPAVFIVKNCDIKKILVASFLGTLSVCMTYQAASGIFPMLVIFVCCLKLIKKKDSHREVASAIGFSALGYALAILFFKFLIMTPAVDYVSNSIPQFKDIIPTLLSNYLEYFQLVMYDFNNIWKLLVVLIVIGFIVSVVSYSKENRLRNLVLALVLVSVTALLMFGLYPILASPSFDARAMYGFGAWVAFISVATVSIIRDYKILSKLFIFALAWSFFTFAFTYGNALYSQKQYTEYRTKEVLYTINNIYPDKEERELHIIGSIDYAPSIQNAIENYPVLSRMVPVTLCGPNSFWGLYNICYYYNTNLYPNFSEDFDTELPMLAETGNFSIKGDNARILVELK